ncbi:helix-turn-helix transcriptional regulator [Streptomyces sp. N35]|uniref:helix-turn-helix domain-containing protein n=1 Tax=Streptomyces sp. N35 TaxID=2795730 RepID=UPI0018F5AA55|nr:helix-turn-helix transcriptional regulator [Streptomyces sp. N35]
MCRERDDHQGVDGPDAEPVELCDLGRRRYREAITLGSTAGEVPDCLLGLGLLRPRPGEPGVFAPVPPDVAARELARPVERAVRDGQQRLLSIEDAFAWAEELYRDEQQRAVAPVRLLQGNDVINAALQKMGAACEGEALAAQPGGARRPGTLARSLDRAIARLEAGGTNRVLYQHSVRSHGPTLAYMEKVSAAGGEFRTLDEMFDRCLIYDRTTAVIPDRRYDEYDNALVVDHPGIVGFLVSVFENAWSRAEPVDFGSPHGRPVQLADERRRAVLRLMVQGHTDAGIAARLGISSRTVSHHIKRASEQFGSASRAELGYLLGESGALRGEG